MAQFRNWIATFGALALGVAVLPGDVGAEGATAPQRPTVETTTPGLPPAINGVAPGPEILHRPPARAPQLENTGVWKAEPTKVCLTSAYRAGEFVYQDCIWDDNGGGPAYRWWAYMSFKTYRYPTDPAYRNNAADIVEVRLKPLDDATAIRITYNTMVDPRLVATTVALGGDPNTPVDVPHGANTKMPAQVFVTARSNGGDIVDAASGQTLPADPVVTTDVERRQVEIRVPYSAFDPRGDAAVRIGAAAGLWDVTNNRYLVPKAGDPTATQPGGATGEHPSAFFNAAFRYDEPVDAAWRDHLQLAAVGKGDLSPFFATVDFTKLAAGVEDDMSDQRGGIPTRGFMSLLFASHFESKQGRRIKSDPDGPPMGTFTQQNGFTREGSPGDNKRPSAAFGWPCRDGCTPDLAGRLQRYLLYVPKAAPPPSGYGTYLWLQGFAINGSDVVYGERDMYRAVGDRPDNPTLVVATDARGADEWGYGESGASNFETWADVARRFKLDPDRTTLAGFSSGAYSASKLTLTFPDVFGRAFICDGLDIAPSVLTLNSVADTLPADTVTVHEPGSRISDLLPSRRNLPVMEWAGSNDDYIPYNITRKRADLYAAGDYDYEFITWHGLAAEHATMCNNGLWSVMTPWLGDMKRVQDPVRVTYVRNPLMDDPGAGLVGNRAYWLSGIETRDRALGTIDVTSGGLGVGATPVPPNSMENSAASSDGITLGSTIDEPYKRHALEVNPYLREYRHLGSGPAATPTDTLTITARNVGALTIDPQRAKVSCSAKLNVQSDGPLSITLLGCEGGPRSFG
jgi:pimeloyl-ACP methyl ester carboxylesterase